MTRTRPFPYLFLMSGTRETSISTGKFTGFRLAPVWPDIEQRSYHRASLVGNMAAGDGPCIGLNKLASRPRSPREGPNHEYRSPAGRRVIAEPSPAVAR